MIRDIIDMVIITVAVFILSIPIAFPGLGIASPFTESSTPTVTPTVHPIQPIPTHAPHGT